MKNLIFIPLLLMCSYVFGQTPVKYSVLIGDDYIQVDPNGNLDTVLLLNNKEPKEYIALIEQGTTDAPTVTIQKNTLGGDISWAYSSTGLYTGTLTGAFTRTKTTVYAAIQGRGSNPRYYVGTRVDDNTVQIESMNSSFTLSDPASPNTFLVTIQVQY